MEEGVLQWHPAFQAAMQIELQEGLDYLTFYSEYNLTKKPLQIDTLIILRKKGYQVRKKFGKLFRQHNIVEYKNPGDYFSINDFYKVMGYACLYQSDTEHVMEILPEEITITLVTDRFPVKLIKHLKQLYGAGVRQEYPGIYYIDKLLFQVQILVNGQLSRKENIWLSRLRRNLSVENDIEILAGEYRGREKNPDYAAVMNLIVQANREQCEEAKVMCEALRELFAEELAEAAFGREQGRAAGLAEGRAEGRAVGRAEAILEILNVLGTVPDQLQRTILEQKDLELLNSWIKLAVRADSVQAFEAGLKDFLQCA